MSNNNLVVVRKKIIIGLICIWVSTINIVWKTTGVVFIFTVISVLLVFFPLSLSYRIYPGVNISHNHEKNFYLFWYHSNIYKGWNWIQLQNCRPLPMIRRIGYLSQMKYWWEMSNIHICFIILNPTNVWWLYHTVN